MSDSVQPHRQAAHQALPSLGCSRQEHWNGMPFPSPMHEREKWKWSHSVVSDSSRPHGLQPTRLLRPWDFPGKSTGVGCHCLLQKGSNHVKIKPHTLQRHLKCPSKTWCAPGNRRKEQWPLLSVGGSLAEVWVNNGLPQGQKCRRPKRHGLSPLGGGRH